MPLGSARLTLFAKPTVAAEAEVIRKKVGVSASGNAQVDTAISKFGGSSLLLDGTGDYLDMDPNWTVGSSDDFTVEQWIYQDNYSATYDFCRMTDGGSNKIVIFINTSEVLNVLVNGSTIYSLNNTQHPLNLTTWHHVALTRSSGTIRLFIDGTQYGSDASNSADLGTIDRYTIGWNQSTGSPAYFDGNIDEVRISNTARYTTGFTPSTTPFVNDDDTQLLLHMNGTDGSTFFEDDNGVGRSAVGVSALGNAQVDTAQSKYGGASALFDGTGDYLQTSQPVVPSSVGFTTECWIRIATTGTRKEIFNQYAVGPDGRFLMWVDTDDKVKAFIGGTNGTNLATTSTLSSGTWYHVAFVTTTGGNAYLFLDGTQEASDTGVTQGAYQGDNLSIGEEFSSGSGFFNGHIDEVRISDSARYTGAFTAPTAPFVNDSNTLLLLHMDGTDASTDFRDDNGTGRSAIGVSAEGDAQIDTAQYKFGGSSLLVDGTGDYIDSPTSSNLILPINADFTIEGWIRPSATTGVQVIATDRNGSLSGSKWDISMWSGSYLVTRTATLLFESGSGAGSIIVISDNNVFTTNTWHHFAVVRSSNEIYLYVDGVDVTNNRAGTRSAAVGSGNLSIGMNPGDAVNTFAGHIDEFRWSDTARYTTGFTAPTAPFQNDSDTALLLHMDGTDGSTTFIDDNGTTP